MTLIVLSFLALFAFPRLGNGQDCLRPAPDEGRQIPFQDERNLPRLPRNTLALVPDYQFYCCGDITDWQAFVAPLDDDEEEDYPYILTLHIWRPNPDDPNNCWDLVGTMPLVGSESSISVRPGDVVGYFQRVNTDKEDGDRIGEGILLDTSVDDVSVWYQTTRGRPSDLEAFPLCISGGDVGGQVLSSVTMAAPAISIDISTSTCPTSIRTSPPSTNPTQSDHESMIPQPTPLTSSTSDDDANPMDPETPQFPPLVSFTATEERSTADISQDVTAMYIIIGVVIAVVLLAVVLTMAVAFGVVTAKKRASDMQSRTSSGTPKSSINLLPKNSFWSRKLMDSSKSFNTASSTLSVNPNYGFVSFNPGAGEHLYSELTLLSQTVGTMSTEGGDYCRLGPNAVGMMGSARNQHVSYSPPMVTSVLDYHPVGAYVPTVEQRRNISSNYEQQEASILENYNQLQFFVEDKVYWAPATTTSGLYAQLASKKYREIHRSQISTMDQLGSGQFGEVYSAIWSFRDHRMQLAVKILKPSATEADKLRFLQEAAIMGQFRHPHIIKLHGVVTMGEPVMICSELLSNGDLKSYLQMLTISSDSGAARMEAQFTFLKFAREIAAGMDYLCQKNFVHRDLAARNILLDDSLTCKIGDFGMARDLMDNAYYRSSGGKVPVKWTAPEALLYKKYSSDSDVYSYGMVLFEIWSVGKKPFSQFSNAEVIRIIQKRALQAPPPGCPRAVYKLMVDCWHPEHNRRPSFNEICSKYLQQPSAMVVHWNSADSQLSPQVGVLGASLDQAFELYLDLQKTYQK